MASSDTGGVQPMTITGRVAFERERLIGMTKEERAWRARYLKSLTLAPEEPVIPENYYKERYHPLKRFYKAPMNAVENALTPVVGKIAAGTIRFVSAKLTIAVIALYGYCYYVKYNKATWLTTHGLQIQSSGSAVYPSSPEYKTYKVPAIEGKNFYSFNFENSPI